MGDKLSPITLAAAKKGAGGGDTKQILEEIEQTPVEAGGETLSTIDEKLNFLVGGNNLNHLSILASYNAGNVTCDTLEDFSTQFNHSFQSCTEATTADVNLNQYVKVQSFGQLYAYWYKVAFKALLTGKYRLLGTGDNINEIVNVTAGDTLITCRLNNGSGGDYSQFPCIGSQGKALLIQYLGE